MKTRLLAIIGIFVLLLGLCACGATKEVECARCGKKLSVPADKDEDDWIFYCTDCEKIVMGLED